MTLTSLRIRSDCASPARGRRWLGFSALLAVTLLASGCSQEAEQTAGQEAKTEISATQTVAPKGSGAVVAKVNGVEVREGDLAQAEEDIGQQMQPMPPDAKRDYLITYVGDMILLTQAAEAKKLHESDEFKQDLEFARKKLLMGKLLESEAKAGANEAAMRKVYDDAVQQMSPEQEVRARHILVETEDEAKALREEIEKGADFADLAKQKSKDTGAAAEGGDLGYFSKEQMVPEFADAAFNLETGQLSEPVKSPFGWHIIKIEDKRTKPVPEFEQVRGQIETFVIRKAQAEYLTTLRQSANIERLEQAAPQPQAEPPEPDKAPEAAPIEPEKAAEPEKK
jgi:peptidyl-prolyl cis-trans isomerase C